MPGSGSETPAVRASDDEREAVVVRLQTAVGEGRLTLDELADRLDRARAYSVMGGTDVKVSRTPRPLS
jgi:hypothetical protein